MKESIETEMTMLARQKEATYSGEKKRANTDLEFFFLVFCCISNMLICWAHKISPPHLHSSCLTVCLYLIMSRSQLPHKKPESSSPFCLSCRGQKHIHFQWFHTCTEGFKPLGFFQVIFNYYECFGPAIWKFLYLFIY